MSREPSHVCEPHENDRWDGWTNCWICWRAIRFDGPPGDRCKVIIPLSGRCERDLGHTGRHMINGIEFNGF